MLNMDIARQCKIALLKDGRSYNIRKFMEECGEASAVISHYIDGKKTSLDVADELADIEITLNIIKCLILEDLESDPVDKQIFEKAYKKKIEKFTKFMNVWVCDPNKM